MGTMAILHLCVILCTVASIAHGGSVADCDFEHGLCQYTQLTSGSGNPHDDFDWTLQQGGTPTIGTGPVNDHTLGNSGAGHYVYTETSAPRQNSDKATIYSPPIQTSSVYSCLTFWYNMYGSSLGTLIMATGDLQHSTTVWSKSDNEGQVWQMANITIDTSHPVQIIFTGTRGPSYTGDMALDDITMTNVSCDHKSALSTTPNLTTTTTSSTSTTTTAAIRPTTSQASTPTSSNTSTTPTTASETTHYGVLEDRYCQDLVSCDFEMDTCDFLPSSDWTRHTANNDTHERFERTLTDSADLRSPVLCNGAVDVQFKGHITTATANYAELLVLTECDGNDLWGQPLQGLRGPTTSWGVFNFSLPACPHGQLQRVIFRTERETPGDVILLDDVLLAAIGGCNKQVWCHFEQSSCGYHGSSDWTIYTTDHGRLQRFESVTSDFTDLRSPALCNGAVHVQFKGHITTATATYAELTVLTECDGKDLWGQPLQGLRGPTTSWGVFDFSLPACPHGQHQRVVFQALRATPGTVFYLDDIIIDVEP